ncbi:MAG: site-2 protease family protein [Candidatus Brocadiia bacterium]
MFGLPDITALLVRLPPLFFALTIHEFAHGYVAYLCGDATAKVNGRLTLNPLAHLDPVGTLCILFAPIGWARPVPVNPANFRHPRRDDILVSLAGVGANLATAVAAAVLLRLALLAGLRPAAAGDTVAVLWVMVETLCLISIGLMIFNLIPVPPLDGSHVLRELLPRNAAMAYAQMAPYAPLILIALVFTGVLSVILGPPLFFLVRVLLGNALIFPFPF